MRFLIFFLIWSGVIGLLYYYVGRRMIVAARLQGKKRFYAWIFVCILLILPQIPFASFIMRKESAVADVLFWPGYISLGFFSLIVTAVFVRDVLLTAGIGTKKIYSFVSTIGKTPDDPPKKVDPERRRFLVHSTNIGLLGLAAGATGYGTWESHRRATIENIAVPLPHLPHEFEGFRIVQFSDLHVGPTIKQKFVEGVAEQLHSLNADVLAFTGDLVDGSVSWLREDVAPLRQLSAPYGKFFITGNHEYYSGAEQWIEEAGRLGFDVLLNEHRSIKRRDAQIVIAGVTDYSAGDFIAQQRSDPAKALHNAPAGTVKILLAHQPKSVYAAAKAGFDLQLSGHTHGGQFVPWNYFAALNQPYVKGLHRHDSMYVYVNRGAGYWGPPLRLGNPPEITVITLTKLPIRNEKESTS